MKRIFLSLLFFCPALALAQPMTWQDVLAQTQLKSPALAKARESVKQAQINYDLSRAFFLPTLSASASKSFSGHDKPVSTTGDNYSYGLTGQLALNNTYTDINGMKSKDIDRKIEELRFKRSVADIIYNIRRSYINLLVAQETLNLTGQIVERRMKNFELVQLKYDAGREDKGSLLRVDADKLQAQYDYDSAKRNLAIVSLQLAKEIGLENYDMIIVTGSIDAVTVPDSELNDAPIDSIPEYLVSKYNLDKTELNMKNARSNMYPDLSFSASIAKSWSDSVQDNTNWYTGLSISYPIYNAGRDKGNLMIAESNRTISEKSFHDSVNQLKISVQQAQVSYTNAIENLKIRQKYLAATEEQSKITTMKYLNGLATYYDWYNVENDMINYQKQMLNTKKDAIMAEAGLKNVLGMGEFK
jgi:outer membrane protein TolC